MFPDGLKWGQEVLFPANPDLADILGDMDFDFENFYFWDFFGSEISGVGPAWAQLGPTHLGPAWAHPLGPGWGPPTWAQLGPTHLGPACLGPPTWAQLGPPPTLARRGPTHLGPAWAHPDAAAAAGRILKSRSRPLPTHPGMKYFREETLAVDWTTKEHIQKLDMFYTFLAHGKFA